MQCLQLTRGDAPSTGVTLELSGDLDSTIAYVTINGTQYATAQTLKVNKGTDVTVTAARQNYYNKSPTISLNGKTVASISGTSGSTKNNTVTYTFAVTDNCMIACTGTVYATVTITMPA